MIKRYFALRRLPILIVGLFATNLPAFATSPRVVVSPRHPTTSEQANVIILRDPTEPCTHPPYFTYELTANEIVFDGKAAPIQCADATAWSVEVPLPALAAGTYQLRVEINDQPYATTTLTVQPAAHEMVIAPHGIDYFGTYFRATVDYALPGDPANEQPARPASASPLDLDLTPNGGLFWFFSPENPEVMIKVRDGRAINGHYWLFVSTMTSLAHTVRVRLCVEGDPPGCELPLEYHSPEGQGLDVIDTEAFRAFE